MRGLFRRPVSILEEPNRATPAQLRALVDLIRSAVDDQPHYNQRDTEGRRRYRAAAALARRRRLEEEGARRVAAWARPRRLELADPARWAPTAERSIDPQIPTLTPR